MIMAAPEAASDRVGGLNHFFYSAVRYVGSKLRQKPVAVALRVLLALGGGGELALAAHNRVMSNDPKEPSVLPRIV